MRKMDEQLHAHDLLECDSNLGLQNIMQSVHTISQQRNCVFS